MKKYIIYQTKDRVGMIDIQDFNVKQLPAIRTCIYNMSDALVRNLHQTHNLDKRLFSDLLLDILDDNDSTFHSQ